ncbi:P-loop containing nucleoside triphosphate hydrolase protein [Xylaria acuta]|nr:P-loop containing nucleoside triphosphate hydrolase protein [Xylaria acuta]
MYHRSDIQMRDHQHQLFKAMDEVDKVVYVAGTGGGKSIAFALPAYVQPEGCNIVIQPTRALQQDTFARLTAMGINVSIWEPHSTNPASAVILVTPEAMARREWKGFAQRQRLHSRIDRVILDEAHEILLSNKTWRPNLLELRDDMDQVSPRQIFLTGTLPPSRVDEFKSKLRLLSDPLQIIRNKCTRDNLKYDYINMDPDMQCPELVHEMVQRTKQQGRRAIIFVLSKVECEDLSHKMSIPKYYSGLPQDDLTNAINTWKADKGAIVATTAMAQGVDHDASLVICLGAYDMMTMCQQFGRAGRDGNPASVVLIAPLVSLKEDIKPFATSACKRSAISKYLDGTPERCGFHHNSCNGCLGLEIKTDRSGNTVQVARSQIVHPPRFSSRQTSDDTTLSPASQIPKTPTNTGPSRQGSLSSSMGSG